MLVTFLEIALLIAISESNSITFNTNREQGLRERSVLLHSEPYNLRTESEPRVKLE